MPFKVAMVDMEPFETENLQIQDSGWVAITRGDLVIYYPPQVFDWIEEV